MVILKEKISAKYGISITFTRAPMTPKLVSLRYSKGLDLLVVFRKGYKYNGICAAVWNILPD